MIYAAIAYLALGLIMVWCGDTYLKHNPMNGQRSFNTAERLFVLVLWPYVVFEAMRDEFFE